ncbi:glycosyltransferase family 4 protein [Agrobacterium rhizogenes]|nr:glycosyltransferase family 4 protein [Rhizobium rhizogenes]
MMSETFVFNRTFKYSVPKSLIGVWVGAGAGFQMAYDIGSDEGLDDLMYWWLSAGRSEFPGVRDVTDQTIIEELHLTPMTKFLDASPKIELTGLLQLVLRHRYDLQALWDVSTREGISDCWDWWLSYGYKEYFGQSNWLRKAEAISLLQCTAENKLPDDSAFSSLLYKLFVSLTVYMPTAINKKKICYQTNIPFVQRRITIDLENPSTFLILIYMNRIDLREFADISTLEGRTQIEQWWISNGRAEYFGRVESDLILEQDEVARQESARNISNTSDVFATKHGVSPPNFFNNVALIGYPKGEFGLGEDIRLLRSSLTTAGIAPEVIQAPWQISARQAIDEPSIDAHSASFDGDVMIYVMPAFDTLTLLNKVGPSAFSARRKIGFWQWELERFPPPARMAMELVDEIWCHSEHSARAFRGATDKPVIRVPLPVMVPELPRVSRSNFGLEDDSFVVFTSFDGASSISRKNPLGAILAFQSAFPRGTHRKARLIVKAMNVHDDSLWRECMRKAAQDPRIIIRNTVMDRLEYYELLQCCDVVLSLHRAEGFGRLMAEAMALGIPVVASAYSGNMDFMNDKNSWLVSGETLPVLFGDYPFYQDQIWFEPDVGSAAEALRDCASNAEKRGQFVIAAKQTMDRYSTQNCGREYLRLLKSRASK